MKRGARPRERPFSRRSKIIAVIVGGLLVWQVLTISLAVLHGNDGDEAAADFGSVSQTAATTAAIQRLNNGDPAGAEVFSKEALSISAISAPSMRTLALAQQAQGRLGEAGATLSQAAALGWRDDATQLWLAQASFQAKDYPSAAQRLDASLRMQSRNRSLFGALDQLIPEQKFADAMVDRMILLPDWRAYYFEDTSDDPAETLQAKAYMIGRLAGSVAPATREEILAVVNGLVKLNQFDQARKLWFGTQNVNAGPLYDGSFEAVAQTPSSPFEWSFPTVLGANAVVEHEGPGLAGSLHASTDGSASGVIARQLVILAAGPHILDYDETSSPAARPAFGWTLRCASTNMPILASSATANSERFEVPSRDCAAQFVELHVRTPAPEGSEARFGHLALR